MTVVVDGVTIRTSLDVAAAYAGTVGATPGGVQVVVAVVVVPVLLIVDANDASSTAAVS